MIPTVLSDIFLECFKPMLEVLLESCVGDKVLILVTHHPMGLLLALPLPPPFPAHSSAVFDVLKLYIELASLELTCLSS